MILTKSLFAFILLFTVSATAQNACIDLFEVSSIKVDETAPLDTVADSLDSLHFGNLKQASSMLAEVSEKYFAKYKISHWLPGRGGNFRDRPEINFKEGRFYAPIEQLLPLREQLIALSYQKMIVINGSHFIFGTFIPDSLFGNTMKSEGAFPSLEMVQNILERQPYLIWNEHTGAVELRTKNLNSFLLNKLKQQANGSPITVYRGQKQVEAVLTQLLSAIGHDNYALAVTLRNQLIPLISQKPTVRPEVLNQLKAETDPKKFAELYFQLVKIAPYLFLTPTKKLAERFSWGGRQLDTYTINLDTIPPELLSKLHIGGDGNGSPPGNLEIGLPYWNIDLAIMASMQLNNSSYVP